MSPSRKKRMALWASALAVISISAFTLAAEIDAGAGRTVDDAFAAKVWSFMAKHRLVGDARMRSHPFEGSRPHGSVQELIATEAVIDGTRGRLIVKHNYGGQSNLTVREVYAAEPAQHYEALTIMFQREAGYDSANNNWFWAEYLPDGSVLNFQGSQLSGRVPLCIGCHTALGGADREILNGPER